MKIRNHVFALLASATMLVQVACAPPGTPEGAARYQPTASIKDIMLGIVDPSADRIWDSTAIIVDADGIRETFPETDEEWEELRYAAIRVIEASNLLLIPGRSVAAPGDRSEFPGIELEPEEIQRLIDDDPERFFELSRALHDAATETMSAIEARDPETLLAIGDNLDLACEACHLEYWYPDDNAARAAFEENLARRRLQQ